MTLVIRGPDGLTEYDAEEVLRRFTGLTLKEARLTLPQKGEETMCVSLIFVEGADLSLPLRQGDQIWVNPPQVS